MPDITPITPAAPQRLTTDFSGKSPAQTASIMKAEAGGVKRNAEQRIWPQINKARDMEDKSTLAYWIEVINVLAEGSEDPKVDTVEPFKGPDMPVGPHLELTT